MIKNFIILSLICLILTACTRAPVKALEAVVGAATDATNSTIDEKLISDRLYDEIAALEAPPPSNIPLTIQLASPIDPAISNLEVYLLHAQIKQIIDKQSFDANFTLIFSPNRAYYKGTYYGDTLAIKYTYQGQAQMIKFPLTHTKNHLTLDFIDNEFQVIDSKYNVSN